MDIVLAFVVTFAVALAVMLATRIIFKRKLAAVRPQIRMPTSPKTLEDQAVYYASHPPGCIGGFRSKPVRLKGVQFDGHLSPPELNPHFQLFCTCGHDHHAVTGYHWRNPDYHNDQVFLSPISLRCASCGKESELIDTDRHGYDAELSGMVATVRAKGTLGEYPCPKCGTNAVQVFVRFEYPDDVLDFEEDYPKHRGRLQELFSWFSAVGKCPNCSQLFPIADFECA